MQGPTTPSDLGGRDQDEHPDLDMNLNLAVPVLPLGYLLGWCLGADEELMVLRS